MKWRIVCLNIRQTSTLVNMAVWVAVIFVDAVNAIALIG